MKFVMVIILAAALLTGCGARAENLQTYSNLKEKNGTVIINDGKEKTYTNIGNAQNRDLENEPAEERAKRITDAIELMDGIKRAAVVVAGNKAIVGLTLNDELDEEKLIEMKRRVDKTVKRTDSGIDHTAVSCAPDLFERISNLNGGTDDDHEKEDLNTDGGNEAIFRLIPTV